MLHSVAKIRDRRFDQYMDMVWHPAVRNDDPATAIDLFTQSASEPIVVPLIMKKFSPAIAASDDVINSAGILKSRKPWHN